MVLGANSRVGVMRRMHLPICNCNYAFDEYSFFLILNFFDNNDLLACINRKRANKMHRPTSVFGEKLRIKGKKFK